MDTIRLRTTQAPTAVKDPATPPSNAASLGKAMKISTELVAAVVVGTTLGYILDSWFDTKPWLIIIFFFLGAAAGMLNVFKAANRMQKEE